MGEKCQHEGVSIEGQNEAQTIKCILVGEGMECSGRVSFALRGI